MHVIYFFLECSCVALCIAIQFQTQEGPLPLVLLWDCVCLLVSAEHNIYCCLVFFFLAECCLVMLPTFEYFTFFQSGRGHGWLNCLKSNEWIIFLYILMDHSRWNLFRGITHWNNITPKVTLRVKKKKKSNLEVIICRTCTDNKVCTPKIALRVKNIKIRVIQMLLHVCLITYTV